MTQQRTYLDYNATAPLAPAARAAVLDALDTGGNPSSVHACGRAARKLVEQARRHVGSLIAARTQDIVFTSGGTEANATAIAGLPAQSLIVNDTEHDSVRQPAQAAGLPVWRLPVGRDGRADLAALEDRLKTAPAPALVCLMLANNEIGVLQPVIEAAELVHAHGGLLHCDAIQAAGRIPLDVTALGVDSLSLSGHKIGAPPGVGALWLRPGLTLRPLVTGGGQELGRRGGTEAVPAIAGFGAAAEAAAALPDGTDRLQALRDRMESDIAALAPDAFVIGANAPRLANTSAIGMPGLAAETQVMAFDLEGISISAGAACSSGKVKVSHVLLAMGLDADEAGCVIRISLGRGTTEADIDCFVSAWRDMYLRRSRRRGAVA